MIAPMPSTASENLMCSIDRPTSVGSRLNAFCAAGVRRRTRRSRPTVTIGKSALLMKFDRSSVNASSSRLRLMNCSLTVVSSSFADCSSSFVVSSSSFVLWSSSLLDSTSSCAARSSWLAASCVVDDGLEILLGGRQLLPQPGRITGAFAARPSSCASEPADHAGPILRFEQHEQAALGVIAAVSPAGHAA